MLDPMTKVRERIKVEGLSGDVSKGSSIPKPQGSLLLYERGLDDIRDP